MKQDQNDYKLINIIVIVSAIGMIVGATTFATLEIIEARDACLNQNGSYSIKPFNHFCNGKLFLKHSYCWTGFDGYTCLEFWVHDHYLENYIDELRNISD
ncbi:MAG: hypothetical protein ACW98D_21665 [Promethearchaeota archaeon]|jgi:hypothetical protein